MALEKALQTPGIMNEQGPSKVASHAFDAGHRRGAEEAEDEELLTTAEVAALVRAPVSTIRYWRHIGSGPASFRLGRRVLYRRGDVRRWLDGIRLCQAERP